MGGISNQRILGEGIVDTVTGGTIQIDADAGVVLALEASTGAASAAVAEGGRVLAETRHDARHGHAARMLPLAQDCLAEAGIAIGNVGAVVAGRGPGSFTGIRVALAAAKGLALGLGIGGFGLPSLEALAHAAPPVAGLAGDAPPRPVAALADTRRGSVFLDCFSAAGRRLGEVRDIPRDGVPEALGAHGAAWIVAVADDGPDIDWPSLLADGGIDAATVPLAPSASHLCGLFRARLAAGAAADCPLEPLYLSEPLLGPATGGGRP